jgi:xanthine dehydrogenase YagT iron-sulfur-binding subunit
VKGTGDMPRRAFTEPMVGGASSGSGVGAVETAAATSRETARVTINGASYELPADPRVTLLDFLREHLGLTGTKVGCDHGQCGACTVLVNGRRINACLSLAVTLAGDEVTTVEGLLDGAEAELHPMQAAFLEHDGFQCGYCTPGQICAAVALLAEAAAGEPSAVTPDVRTLDPIVLTDEEIRERMSGNLCRCGAYPNIVAAVRAAARGRTR